MSLFLKTIGKNNKAVAFNKSEKPKYIAAYLHPHFPYIVGIHQFCEILRRDWIEVSYQLHNPQYFFDLGTGKRVEEFFNRRNTSGRFEKIYPSHATDVNISVNLVKKIDRSAELFRDRLYSRLPSHHTYEMDMHQHRRGGGSDLRGGGSDLGPVVCVWGGVEVE